MLAAFNMLAATNIHALMAEELQSLNAVDPQDLLDIGVHFGVTPPEVLEGQDPNDLDDDFRQSLMLDIAKEKVGRLLDDLVALPSPWEEASDVVITIAVNQAVGALDTPEERQALWNKLQQVWANIQAGVRARRERRQARRAERAQG